MKECEVGQDLADAPYIDIDALPAGGKALVQTQHAIVDVLDPIAHFKDADIFCQGVIPGFFAEMIHASGIVRLLIPMTIPPAIQRSAHPKADNGRGAIGCDHQRIQCCERREEDHKFNGVLQQIHQRCPDSISGSRAAGAGHRSLVHFPADMRIFYIGIGHGERLVLDHGANAKADFNASKLCAHCKVG